MKCNPVNRVDPGNGRREKPSNTELAKQMEERIAKMNIERAKQDQIWTQVNQSDNGKPKFFIN